MIPKSESERRSNPGFNFFQVKQSILISVLFCFQTNWCAFSTVPSILCCSAGESSPSNLRLEMIYLLQLISCIAQATSNTVVFIWIGLGLFSSSADSSHTTLSHHLPSLLLVETMYELTILIKFFYQVSCSSDERRQGSACCFLAAAHPYQSCWFMHKTAAWVPIMWAQWQSSFLSPQGTDKPRT